MDLDEHSPPIHSMPKEEKKTSSDPLKSARNFLLAPEAISGNVKETKQKENAFATGLLSSNDQDEENPYANAFNDDE